MITLCIILVRSIVSRWLDRVLVPEVRRISKAIDGKVMAYGGIQSWQPRQWSLNAILRKYQSDE